MLRFKPNRMFWMFLFLFCLCPFVMADGAATSTPAMPTGVPEMLINLVISWLLPVVVIPFILQCHWPENTKRAAAAAICFCVALLATILNQQYSFHLVSGGSFGEQVGNFASWFLVNATIILTATKALFENFWRDTGLPDTIEAATSRKATSEEKVLKATDKAQKILSSVELLAQVISASRNQTSVLKSPVPVKPSNQESEYVTPGTEDFGALKTALIGDDEAALDVDTVAAAQSV